MIRFGGKEPVDIVIGGKVVSSISMNGDVVWTNTPVVQPDYFYIKNLDTTYYKHHTLTLTKVGSPTTGSDLEYSVYTYDWHTGTYVEVTPWTLCTYDSQGILTLDLPGTSEYDTVYFRSSTGFSQNENNYYKFDSDFSYAIGGDITTLSDYTNNSLNYINIPYIFDGSSYLFDASNLDCSKLTIIGQVNVNGTNIDCSFVGSFRNSNIGGYSSTGQGYPPDFPNLTTISQRGMYECFKGSSLTQAPDLSNVTTIGNYGLYDAFKSSSLSQAPDLSNVTSVSGYGLYGTFQSCHFLSQAPDLSNVTSVGYNGMSNTFNDCYNLTQGADLSNVTSISMDSFIGCFYGCHRLTTATAPNVSSWNTAYFNNWLYDVAQNGTLYKPAGLTVPDSTSGCPTTAYGWTTVDY